MPVPLASSCDSHETLVRYFRLLTMVQSSRPNLKLLALLRRCVQLSSLCNDEHIDPLNGARVIRIFTNRGCFILAGGGDGVVSKIFTASS